MLTLHASMHAEAAGSRALSAVASGLLLVTTVSGLRVVSAPLAVLSFGLSFWSSERAAYAASKAASTASAAAAAAAAAESATGVAVVTGVFVWPLALCAGAFATYQGLKAAGVLPVRRGQVPAWLQALHERMHALRGEG